MTVAEALARAASELEQAAIPGPRLDAEVLLGHVLGCRRLDLFAAPERVLGEEEAGRFDDLVARRLLHEPVAYLTGEREFFGTVFRVEPGVLIPRPDTEEVIERALALAGRPKRIIDIGTGSGAIAITLARLLPDAEVWASDISATAIGCARKNAARLLPDAPWPRFVTGDLFADAPGAFDLVISNPPYLSADELACADADVRDWEPELALVAEDAGLAVYRRIIAAARARLTGAGLVVFEISDSVAAGVEAAAKNAGFSAGLFQDLSGHLRVAVLKNP